VADPRGQLPATSVAAHLKQVAFVKGRSGNPGDRPKELRDALDLVRRHPPDAIESLAPVMNFDIRRPPPWQQLLSR
jgi:hypothetical protein